MYFLVGVHKTNPKLYRVLDAETKICSDLTIADITSIGIKLVNAEVVNGDLKGTNGAIGRYGLVKGKQVPVVLYTIHRYGVEFVSYYEISDSDGNVKIIYQNKFIEIVKNTGIANGKLVKKKNGLFISSIKAEYPIKLILDKETLHQSESQVYNEMLELMTKSQQSLIAGKPIIEIKDDIGAYMRERFGTLGASALLWESKGSDIIYRDLVGKVQVQNIDITEDNMECLRGLIKDDLCKGRTNGLILYERVPVYNKEYLNLQLHFGSEKAQEIYFKRHNL